LDDRCSRLIRTQIANSSFGSALFSRLLINKVN